MQLSPFKQIVISRKGLCAQDGFCQRPGYEWVNTCECVPTPAEARFLSVAPFTERNPPFNKRNPLQLFWVSSPEGLGVCLWEVLKILFCRNSHKHTAKPCRELAQTSCRVVGGPFS